MQVKRTLEAPTVSGFTFGSSRGIIAHARRRDPNAQQETWQIYYGDVHVGTISERTGNPTGTPSWHGPHR